MDVVHRESGEPMTINARDYDPALHAIDGEELPERITLLVLEDGNYADASGAVVAVSLEAFNALNDRCVGLESRCTVLDQRCGELERELAAAAAQARAQVQNPAPANDAETDTAAEAPAKQKRALKAE